MQTEAEAGACSALYAPHPVGVNVPCTGADIIAISRSGDSHCSILWTTIGEMVDWLEGDKDSQERDIQRALALARGL